MILFGIVSESFHRSVSSVFAALVPLAHKMAKRSRHSFDDVSDVEGTSTKSIPEWKRGIALATVRQHESSLLISAQEKTQSDLKCRGRASGDRLHFPGVQAPGRLVANASARHRATDCNMEGVSYDAKKAEK